MEDVTGQWRFRDGRPMVAAYAQGNTILAIGEDGWRSDLYDAWKHNKSADAIMPVDPPKVWRPFRDLEEAFSVMGPFAYSRGVGGGDWQHMRYWNPQKQTIDRQAMRDMFDHCEWTLDPSQPTGNRCGVEE